MTNSFGRQPDGYGMNPQQRVRRILVFPAGTEIGLEIHAALRSCKEVCIFGAGADVSNHARFAYSTYGILPTVHEQGWLDCLIAMCRELSIDYIFPAHDDAVLALSENRGLIPAVVLIPTAETCEITRSKLSTYKRLQGLVPVPLTYDNPSSIEKFPVFIKPDRGQGSIGARKVESSAALLEAIVLTPDLVISEFLPGEEYTVDCFSDRERGLLFAGARRRHRMRNGISVNTASENLPEAWNFAKVIGSALSIYGAWFFQLKRDLNGTLKLLEVATRIAGTMAAHRVSGINFPLLSIFEHERLPLEILHNPGRIELDRALCNRYLHSIVFKSLYVDLDDTLICAGKVNTDIIKFIFACINRGKRVTLLTRHHGDLQSTLDRHRLSALFDSVIHLQDGSPKSTHISETDAIFIDDSFSERMEVFRTLGILTFDCSMIEVLIQQAQLMDS